MSRRDLSLTIALCASLLAHGLLALITFEGARRQLAAIRLPGYPRQSSDTIAAAAPLVGIRLGGLSDDGLSPNASPGREGLRAKEAPGDQALLSRDPQGPGRVGDLPSFSLVPQTDGPAVDAAPAAAAAVMRSVAVLPTPTESAQPFGAGPNAELAVLKPRRAAAPAPPAPASAAPDTLAKSNRPAADPAVMSASESDAFSALGGIEFRDGRMESRLGRSFKSVRPRLSFAAQLDLLSISNPRLVLKVAIDTAGNVTAVDVVKSTGSTLIDQPVKVAMYQWWFEPAKGPGGKAVGETFLFPISWH
jgi:TonB family protein